MSKNEQQTVQILIRSHILRHLICLHCTGMSLKRLTANKILTGITSKHILQRVPIFLTISTIFGTKMVLFVAISYRNNKLRTSCSSSLISRTAMSTWMPKAGLSLFMTRQNFRFNANIAPDKKGYQVNIHLISPRKHLWVPYSL